MGASADPQSSTSSSGPVMLKLWKDGFTVNDGEFRPYKELKNMMFLEDIKKGKIPEDMQDQIHGKELRLDVEDHRHENYVPPKAGDKKVKVFSGKGHMLGRYILL